MREDKEQDHRRDKSGRKLIRDRFFISLLSLYDTIEKEAVNRRII